MIYTTNWNKKLNRAIHKIGKVRNSFLSSENTMNLICAFKMDFKKNVYRYPITNFIVIKDKLDIMLTNASLNT